MAAIVNQKLKRVGWVVLASTLIFAASHAAAQRSILPPLGNQPGSVDQNQGGSLGNLPDIGSNPQGDVGSGGVLGTMPGSALENSGSGNSGLGSSGANEGASRFAPVFTQIKGPMPTAGIQSTARELLADQAFRRSGGADGLAKADGFYQLGFIEDATGTIVDIEGLGVPRLASTGKMMLALGRNGQACETADVSSLPKGAEPGPTFTLLEILAFCKLENGDKKSAKLVASIVQDQGGGDRLYQALMKGAIAGKAPRLKLAKGADLRPVHVALFTRIGLPIPSALIAKADLSVLANVARRAAGPGLKLAATERLVSAGLGSFADLDDLYAQIGPPNFDPATALKNKVAGSALGRAQIYRLLDEVGDDETRLALAIAAHQAGRADKSGATMAVIFSDVVADIVPRPELARYAPGAIKLLLDADRADIAAGWIAAGEFADNQKSRLSPVEAHKYKVISAILAPDAEYGLGTGTLGADAGGAKISKKNRAFIAREAQLLGALGDYVPPVLAELSKTRPVQAQGAGDYSAAQALQALAPLSGARLEKLKIKTITGAILALRGMGLEGEARRLAADDLMARL